MKALLIISAALAAAAGGAQAQTTTLFPPEPVVFVTDLAKVLKPATLAKLNADARATQAALKADIAMVTLPDLKGYPVNEVARDIARAWKVGATGPFGSAQRNLGVVMLVVVKATSSDGRGYCWIAPGAGAEDLMVAGDYGAICGPMAELFRLGSYDQGMLVGERLVSQLIYNNVHPESAVALKEVAARNQPQALAAVRNERLAGESAARNQRLANRQNIVRRLRIEGLVPGSDLSANPFPYQGKVVGVLTVFSAMRDANSAWFGNQQYLVLGVPSTRFPRPVEVLLAARVLGTQKVTILGTEVTVPKLQYVDAYPCQQSGCSELNP